jgi:hypothetical protein
MTETEKMSEGFQRTFLNLMIVKRIQEINELNEYINRRLAIGFDDYRIKNLTAEIKYFNYCKLRLVEAQAEPEIFYTRELKLCSK